MKIVGLARVYEEAEKRQRRALREDQPRKSADRQRASQGPGGRLVFSETKRPARLLCVRFLVC